ncbi:hypothetical protein GCM10009123_21320 [Kangiella japonica]|uniref:Uncharacterized protein n=1 Tax=Kangiella japonica TaxID=647384 RepID=A0ABP3CRZ3_9GAMM
MSTEKLKAQIDIFLNFFMPYPIVVMLYGFDGANFTTALGNFSDLVFTAQD